MRRPTRPRTRLLTLAAAAGLIVPAIATTGGTASAAQPTTANKSTHAYSAGRYIVTFADDPVASYDGYRTGYDRTRPARGQKLDARSTAAKAWASHLKSRHDAALSAVGASKIYDYTTTNNAVATDLSAHQAAELAKYPGVVGLEKDQLRHPDTTESPEFLGLTKSDGLWSQLGGDKKAGAGIVVGVIDTGIWPESEAFAGGTGIPVPSTWHGTCVVTKDFPAGTCNDKLVGARYYIDGFGQKNIAKDEYVSPRDGEGHGSHTASTAAGNSGTHVTIDGNVIDDGSGSGMAPGAKVAMYKVCWSGGTVPDGCFNSDSVAAINQAVRDGVDVLNYSIGGTSESSVLDSVEQAFRGASNAGVFVANSAGNSGPGASTLDHPSPWLTTVAAATFRRAFQAVELGNGERYVGASTTPSLPTLTPLVSSVSVKNNRASTDEARLCFEGSLDPAKAAGKVIQCDRGVNDRIAKGFAVKEAGGVGLILTNTNANSLNGDYHPVPAVHINVTDGAKVKAYISAGGATAKIVPLTATELAAAPQVPEITDFSSRGPSTTTGGDILKPDIAAPGNDVVAAVAPPFNHGRSWDFYSGTSMASPHIAGIGALLAAAHPDWLPSEIKSAIMTSARDTVSSAEDPFAQGAGFVDPNPAANPGLVYPTTPNEYRQYMVGLGVQFAPPFDTLTPISGSELNQASIAIGSVAGSQTIHRRVHNVGGKAVYQATANVPGFDVKVSPSTLSLKAGATGDFTVTLTRTTATLGDWATGSLVWSDGSPQVRSPIAVRPVAIAAPAEVHGAASASGSQSFQVTPGFTGSLTSTVHGLAAGNDHADSVSTGAFDIDNPSVDNDTKMVTVTVPANSEAARFTLDSDDDTADLDLFVYKTGTNQLVDLSASGSADEQVTMLKPAAATFDVYVNGFNTPGGSTSYHLFDFEVGSGTATNATVTPNPAAVRSGVPTTLTANWSGLDAAKRYLGVISYSGADEVTLLSVG